ncbi:MAG: hypothetical protein IH852_11060 [Bacteroidetes bacterium]|nr:hypothetical protein [Bacteroidota bacterium]
MKTITLLLTLFVLFSVCDISAQNFRKKSAFVSGLIGGAQISNSNNGSENPVAISFGGSFGIPITKNLFLYTRGSFTSKSNFQSFYNTSYLSSQIQFSDQFVEVNSSFSQLLFNGGLLYSFNLSDEFALGISGGATFAVINQEAKLLGGHVISNVDNETIWGYFGGAMVEKYWEDKNVTTFIEAQYNFLQSDAPYHPTALNNLNFTFGVRYYLSRSSF